MNDKKFFLTLIDKLEKKIVARIKTCRSLTYSPTKTIAYSQSIKIVQEELLNFKKTYFEDDGED